MSRQLSLEEVHNGQALLLELLQEVSEEEGTLSGGTKIATPSNELLRLRESKVIMRNPRNHLTRLTNKLFDTAGIELTEIYKHQIGDQFDFYYMTLTVSLQSAPGIPFRQLHFSLDFGPKGVDEPIIQTMFPKGEWKEILSWGGGLSLALNGNLDWGAEVSNIPPMFDIASLPGHIRANIASNGKLNAFITVP